MDMELFKKISSKKANLRKYLKMEGYTEDSKNFLNGTYNTVERFYKLKGEFEICVSWNLELLEVFVRYTGLPLTESTPGSNVVFKFATLTALDVDDNDTCKRIADAEQLGIDRLSFMYGLNK